MPESTQQQELPRPPLTVSTTEMLYASFVSASAPGGTAGKIMKRLLDILIAGVGLLLLTPLLVLAAIAIKVESRGPVFFRLARVGQGGRHFVPWKFRTMVTDAISKGDGFMVSRDDVRITRVGRLLRNTSLDEVPQLINVLKGEMSLVGPRPSWPYQVERYSPEQVGRLRVRPGITGLAAINGRNAIPWNKRIEIDNWYIDHWSLWLDLKVLVITPWKVLTREGIYGQDGVNEDIQPPPRPTD